MSKRISNHKGWPSKNKGNNIRLKRLRERKEKLYKLEKDFSLEEKFNTAGRRIFDAINSSIRAITPKRFIHRNK